MKTAHNESCFIIALIERYKIEEKKRIKTSTVNQICRNVSCASLLKKYCYIPYLMANRMCGLIWESKFALRAFSTFRRKNKDVFQFIYFDSVTMFCKCDSEVKTDEVTCQVNSEIFLFLRNLKISVFFFVRNFFYLGQGRVNRKLHPDNCLGCHYPGVNKFLIRILGPRIFSREF